MTDENRAVTVAIGLSSIAAFWLAISSYVVLAIVQTLLPVSFVLGGAAVLLGVIAPVNARRLGQTIWWLGLAGALLGAIALVINTLV